MKPNTARVLRALFYVYFAFTFFHIAYVVYHEPFAFDAWNVADDTHAKPATVGRFFEFWYQQYTSSNPRIGQPMAYWAYKTVGFAELLTPVAFFSVVIAGFVIGTGRWPSRKNDRDLAVIAIGIGMMWFVAPNFPAYLFCRAYATNYVYLAAIQMWFLVPLRLLDEKDPAPVSVPKLVAYALLGVVAGMGNEHVGPTLILFVFGYGIWVWRRHHTRPPLLWAGAIGLLVGYALIFFAPGQSQRYQGLAEKYTVIQQIIVRGVRGNVQIFMDMLEAIAPLLVVFTCALAIGMIAERRSESDLGEVRPRQRRAITVLLFGIGASTLITITVFASPLMGPRFYIHSMLIVLAGVLGVISAFLHRPKSFAPFLVLALVASTYAALRTIPMYTRLHHDSNERLAGLASAPLDSNYTSVAWEQIGEMWWFLGDDFRDQKKQELVSRYFGLHRVLFRGGDRWKTLGVTDVKMTSHYEFEQPRCIDEIDQLDIKDYIGMDVGAIHHAFLDAIAEIQRYGKLKWIDLRATFLGSQPPMPPGTLFVAKWNHGVLEGHKARLRRLGRSKQREIVLPPELKKEPWDIYMILIGDRPRKLGVSTDGKPLLYTPWESGNYWSLACRGDECWVILAVAHAI